MREQLSDGSRLWQVCQNDGSYKSEQIRLVITSKKSKVKLQFTTNSLSTYNSYVTELLSATTAHDTGIRHNFTIHKKTSPLKSTQKDKN